MRTHEQAYFDRGMNDVATFEFLGRRLPARRNFLMAAGIELVLDYLCGLGFLDSQHAELDNAILLVKSTTPRPRRARSSIRRSGSRTRGEHQGRASGQRASWRTRATREAILDAGGRNSLQQ